MLTEPVDEPLFGWLGEPVILRRQTADLAGVVLENLPGIGECLNLLRCPLLLSQLQRLVREPNKQEASELAGDVLATHQLLELFRLNPSIQRDQGIREARPFCARNSIAHQDILRNHNTYGHS